MEEFNHFPDIADGLKARIHEAVSNVAEVLSNEAYSKAPKDTGFLARSIYMVASDKSTYGKRSDPAKKGSYLLPEIEKPDDEFTAYVGVGADYGVYVELGTRHAPAQPYLAPAAEGMKRTFDKYLNNIFYLYSLFGDEMDEVLE